MVWRKSPQALIDLFYEALPDDSRIERRKMFGYPCAFVNGNMCTGLHQEDFIVRLSQDDREAAHTQFGAKPFDPMKGRPMREYISLPEEIVADKNALKDW
ncbi:MAG: TfoX/Sxy family protein, partial [Methyloligellaceae bacterium]